MDDIKKIINTPISRIRTAKTFLALLIICQLFLIFFAEDIQARTLPPLSLVILVIVGFFAAGLNLALAFTPTKSIKEKTN